MRPYLYVMLSFLFITHNLHSQWVQTNGPCGGNVNAIASTATQLFSGTDDGGVYVSAVDAISWRAINTGLTNLDVTALIAGNGKLFAGTYGGGVFLSINNGSSWVAIDSGLSKTVTIPDTLIPTSSISSGNFRISRNSSSTRDTIVNEYFISSLTTSGRTLFAGTFGGGVYRFIDSGRYWISADSGLGKNSWVFSLAATDSTVFAATGTGLYCTLDSGTSWNAINDGLIDGIFTHNIHAVAILGNTVFAGTDIRGVFRSTNNGSTWQEVNNGLTNKLIHSLIVSSGNIFAGTEGGVFLSTNNGWNWTSMNNGLTNMYILSLFAGGNNLFAGTKGAGIFLSSDNGPNWTAINQGLINCSVYTLTSYDSNLLAGTDDGKVFLSSDNGMNWTRIYSDSSNYPVSALARSRNILFAGIDWEGIVRSTNNGTMWSQANNGLTNSHVMAIESYGDTVLAGTLGGAFLSGDNGSTWTGANNGLTNIQIHDFTRISSTIYAGTEGGVFSTTNGGSMWTSVSNKFADSFILAIAANNNAIFAGTWGDGVFRFGSSDTNWIAANGGLTNKYIHSLFVIDSNVFAGTEHGIFLSTNNGQSWLIADSGLSGKYIQSLSVSGGNLFAGTSGNSVWRRPLSEMIVTGIEDEERPIPSRFVLLQNYPNPFNPTTTISYRLPAQCHVILKVFDVLGREVATLVNAAEEPGQKLVTFNARMLASGVYFYRLQTGLFTETRKLVLLR